METTARLSHRLNATGYSIHAGVRSQSDLNTALDAVKRMSDQFQCRVGIEGLYPPSARENHWLLSTWAEYREMLDSGVDYALDLSHLNIVGKREKFIDIEFTTELLQSSQCMEIHISDNNGRADSHRPLTIGNEPWWWDVLVKADTVAPVFYEGAIYLPKSNRNQPYKV
jgi:sugar phosphate isomerase/epimerase